MADDLVASGKLRGLDHLHVLSLLGNPDAYRDDGWDMSYDLGSEYMTSKVLGVRFDKRKRVAEYEVKSVDLAKL